MDGNIIVVDTVVSWTWFVMAVVGLFSVPDSASLGRALIHSGLLRECGNSGKVM